MQFRGGHLTFVALKKFEPATCYMKYFACQVILYMFCIGTTAFCGQQLIISQVSMSLRQLSLTFTRWVDRGDRYHITVVRLKQKQYN
jgi:hypothetical protein